MYVHVNRMTSTKTERRRLGSRRALSRGYRNGWAKKYHTPFSGYSHDASESSLAGVFVRGSGERESDIMRVGMFWHGRALEVEDKGACVSWVCISRYSTLLPENAD